MHGAAACVPSSGEHSTSRRTPATFDLNADKEILAGEHTQNVGRTPAKPAFTGEKQFADDCGFRCL